MLNMKELYKKITKSLEECKPAYGKTMFLVVGVTGAGKSTTINYLLHYPMAIGDGGAAVPQDPSIPEPCETGSGATAVTAVPAAYALREGPIVCDCPGFEDNRGPEERVAVSISTESVVRHANKIQGLVVVIDYPLIQTERSFGLRKVALTVGSLLARADIDISKSILFVITKADLRYVTPRFLLEKVIPENITAMEKKVSELSSMSAMLKAGADFLKGVQGDKDTTEKEEGAKLALSILRIMLENPTNVVICDIFDKGESRSKILERMKELQKIPETAFDFSEADSVRREFTEEVRAELVDSMIKLKQHEAFPNQIREREETVKKLQMELESFQSQKNELGQGDGRSLDEKNSRIQENERMLSDNLNKISELEQVIKDQREKVRKCDIELGRFDTEEEMLFFAENIKEGRGGHILKDTFTPMGALVDVVAEEAHDPVIGLAGGTIAVVVGTAIAPLAAIYGTFKRLSHTFEYHGAPYTRVETQSSHVNSFKIIEKSPEKGIYKAIYESDRGRTAKASVTIYGEKRDFPDNRIKITQLKEYLQQLDNAILSTTFDLDTLRHTNHDLENIIAELKIEKQVNIERQKLMLDGLITRAQERMTVITEEISQKQDELENIRQMLLDKTKLFDMIIELSNFIDFNSTLYSNLLDTFVSAYRKFSIQKAISSAVSANSSSFFQPSYGSTVQGPAISHSASAKKGPATSYSASAKKGQSSFAQNPVGQQKRP